LILISPKKYSVLFWKTILKITLLKFLYFILNETLVIYFEQFYYSSKKKKVFLEFGILLKVLWKDWIELAIIKANYYFLADMEPFIVLWMYFILKEVINLQWMM
jgi:hypothetical protein